MSSWVGLDVATCTSVPDVGDEERVDALTYVCRMSNTVTEARQLGEMLGLLQPKEEPGGPE